MTRYYSETVMKNAMVSDKQVVLMQQSGNVMNISLRQLRAFVAVAETGSFTEAARRMHLTQSAISMVIRQLEDELMLPLFDRHGRGTSTTEAGTELLPLVRRILRDLELVAVGAADIRTLRRGVLRIGATQMLACTFIPPLVREFEKRFPHVEVQLLDTTVDELVTLVRRGEVDLGIGPERRLDEDITRDFLFEVPLCLVCAQTHSLAQSQEIPWSQIGDVRWINYSAEFSHELPSLLAGADIPAPAGVIRDIHHMTTAIALAGQSLGITIAPEYVSPFILPMGAHMIRLTEPIIQRRFFAYRQSIRTMSPVTSTFLNILREHLGRLATSSGQTT